MSRKQPRGYFVRGEFIAAGSAADTALRRERAQAPPSKTELKARSSALQQLGVRLAALPLEQVRTVGLPDRLVDAIEQLAGIHAFEGARRQRQYVGKLMRKLSADDIRAVQESLDRAEAGGAHNTELLHATEDWRERLVASDQAATDWARQFPATDIQQIRTLVRQVRADEARWQAEQAELPAGQSARRGRAWRGLYRVLHAALDAAHASTLEETDKNP